jgi:site-specific recombinase XerD
MNMMTLHHATIQYLVYLQALGLSAKRMSAYRRALVNIDSFYGPDTPLESLDNHVILDYIQDNDPFETDLVKAERGLVFCKFTHWLMKNHLIPAWAEEMEKVERDEVYSCSSLEEDQIGDDLLL